MGAAIHFGKLRVAPTIRYTRWDKDPGFPHYSTKADQVEFLTSVAWGTSSDPVHATGHRLSPGVLVGLSAIGEFYNPNTGVKERVGDLGGVSGLLELRQGLALEVDAIYRPLHNGVSDGLEAGPSFRASGNLNGYNPSHFGVTAGAGMEIPKGWALLSTALRYTRWAKDGSPNYLRQGGQHDYPRTNVNAVEVIFGIGF